MQFFGPPGMSATVWSCCRCSVPLIRLIEVYLADTTMSRNNSILIERRRSPKANATSCVSVAVLFLLPPTKEEVNVFWNFFPAFVCLPVSKITQNACMDSDEMLRVDRCRDMDEQHELINF